MQKPGQYLLSVANHLLFFRLFRDIPSPTPGSPDSATRVTETRDPGITVRSPGSALPVTGTFRYSLAVSGRKKAHDQLMGLAGVSSNLRLRSAKSPASAL
jgi:hypothetical protein